MRRTAEKRRRPAGRRVRREPDVLDTAIAEMQRIRIRTLLKRCGELERDCAVLEARCEAAERHACQMARAVDDLLASVQPAAMIGSEPVRWAS